MNTRELLDELKERVSTEEILNELDYSDIVEYVAEVEKDEADDEYDRISNR